MDKTSIFTEISHSPPSRNQFRTPSSVLLSSRKLSPTVLASSQKSNSTNSVNDLNAKQANFYSKYDSTEGVTTAVVLGGFFVFVCLLVVYKTKLKPLWKERIARRQCSSPNAHRSDLARSLTQPGLHKETLAHVCLSNLSYKYHQHQHLLYLQWRVLSCLLFVDLSGNMTKLIIKDFECIPLQTLHNETCATLADDEIFYSDEFGNFVFPIVQQEPGSCSCPHR